MEFILKNKIKKISLFVIVLFLTFPLLSEDIVDISVRKGTNGIVENKQFEAAVVVNIKSPWHINSNQPKGDFTVKTEVRIDSSEKYSIDNISYPDDEVIYNEALEQEQSIYKDTVIIEIRGRIASNLKKDNVKIKGSLNFQGCNDATCLPPEEEKFEFVFPILEDSEDIEAINQNYFSDVSDTEEFSAGEAVQNSQGRMQVGDSIEQKGFLLTYLLIFVGGLGLVLTPCIYPLIPITVSFFGGQEGRSKTKSLLMALVYVLGLALTNSVLGTIAALTGGLIGGILSNPFVLIGLAIILISLAMSMFGVYEFSLPAQISNLGGNKEGYLGAFITGLTLGIVAAPCIGPFIIGLLTYVASLGNPIIGFTMFFTLSIGMGLPFVFLAYFSNQINKLPDAGEWMVGVRRIFGLVLVGMAIYFLRTLIGINVYNYVLPLFLLGSGLFLLFVHFTDRFNHIFKIIKTVIAAGAIFTAGFMLSPAGSSKAEGLQWQEYNEKTYQEALTNARPTILDFSAEWCVKCKELEETTFKDSKVIKLGQGFNLIKVDLTNRASPRVKRLREKFDIKGLPTIVFLSEEGEELEEKRIFGYIEAQRFSEKMQSILDR